MRRATSSACAGCLAMLFLCAAAIGCGGGGAKGPDAAHARPAEYRDPGALASAFLAVSLRGDGAAGCGLLTASERQRLGGTRCPAWFGTAALAYFAHTQLHAVQRDGATATAEYLLAGRGTQRTLVPVLLQRGSDGTWRVAKSGLASNR